MPSKRIISILRMSAMAAFVAAVILARGDKTLLAIVILLFIGNLLFVAVMSAEAQRIGDSFINIMEAHGKAMKAFMSVVKFINPQATSKQQTTSNQQNKEDV